MVVEKYTFLRFIAFKDLLNWSAATPVVIESKFNNVKLSSVIKRIKTPIKIEDNKQYTRITIRQYGNGVYARDTLTGKNIGTKNQFLATSGQLIVSGIDARNGSMGIVPKELNNAIVTNDFWLFDISEDVVSQYLVMLISSAKFQNFWQNKSSGTTNRQRINQTDFLNIKIPLPPLETQQAIIEKYNSAINVAIENEQKADELELSIDTVLYEELEIKNSEETVSSDTRYKHLRLVKFSDLANRWEHDNKLESVINRIKKGKYPAIQLSMAFNFINRSWKKQKYNKKTFNYIEIGGVDSFNGIVETNEIAIPKAPSRATQTVETGDLIIGTTRPNLKKFAIVEEKQNGFICSSGFQVIESSKKYNLEYLLIVLKFDLIIKQFEIIMTGALYPAINQEQLKGIIIPLPPLDVQDKIVSQIFLIKQKIKELRGSASMLRDNAKTEFESEIFNI